MPNKALDLFNQIKNKGFFFKPSNMYNEIQTDWKESDIIIHLMVINALSQIGDFDLCQSIIEQIPKDYLVNNKIETALIDMWVSFY